MDDPAFLPFYERLAIRFPVHVVGKLLLSVLIGLVFLTAHYMSIRSEVFNDWSWFLGVLISTAMLCLYYATHTLHAIIPEMDTRLRPDSNEIYMIPLKQTLSDRNFLLAGLFFGLLNCGFGYTFGLPYDKGPAVSTILIGFFLAGFVCGMAVFGIYGVSVAINTFSLKVKRSLDLTSPDRCGGMRFLGEALVVFSSVTLIVGVMISVYILRTDWGVLSADSTTDNTWWITSLMWFWVAFPYVASLVALIAPALGVNRAMREYKMEGELVFRDQLAELRTRLEDNNLDTTSRSALRQDYEFQSSMRENLHRMRTWPFDLSSNLKYFAVFGANLSASTQTASAWIDKFSNGAP
jgi:hypothetical protein